MSYFPIYLDMRMRRCLVIGGGAVAERKIAALLEAGADITVISPDTTEAIAALSKRKAVRILERRYQDGDLDGFELAFVATDDPQVNAAVYQEGRRRGVWVNSADDPTRCDFILPSVLRRGELTVAVSTGGGSPALARTVREELELYFTEEYESLAKLATEVRQELLSRAITVSFENWRSALSGEVRQMLMRGDFARAKGRLLTDLGVSS
ncbi:MAG TPA: bifunctional precorrin-2 dehydrogenase/sirohydrochlorin ferrochelatase [Candidatus Binatia bacterium]|jgi:siroheme synthase-like protein